MSSSSGVSNAAKQARRERRSKGFGGVAETIIDPTGLGKAGLNALKAEPSGGQGGQRQTFTGVTKEDFKRLQESAPRLGSILGDITPPTSEVSRRDRLVDPGTVNKAVAALTKRQEEARLIKQRPGRSATIITQRGSLLS